MTLTPTQTEQDAAQIARMKQDITDDAAWLAQELSQRGITLSPDTVRELAHSMTGRSWQRASREVGVAASLLAVVINDAFQAKL